MPAPATPPARLVVISGCSGGGKSTLLDALARRGLATAEEPGRRVVREQLAAGGVALPWTDPEAFLARVVEIAMREHDAAMARGGATLFDRSVVDAAAWYRRMGRPVPEPIAAALRRCRYDGLVLMAPPWREIFAADAERRHGFDEAVAEYETLAAVYAERGHRVVELPRLPLEARLDFVVEQLRTGASGSP